MRASKSPFQSYKSKRTLSFANLIVPQFPDPGAKNSCLRFAIVNYSETLQNIFEVELKKCGVFVQKNIEKKYFEIKNWQIRFCCSYVTLTTVQI